MYKFQYIYEYKTKICANTFVKFSLRNIISVHYHLILEKNI